MRNPIIFVLSILAFIQAFAVNPAPQKQGDAVWGWENKHLQAPLMQARLVKKYPKQIKKEAGTNTIKVYGIDLDSDGNQDYIVHYENVDKTCFIRSDLSKQWCNNLGYQGDTDYYYFAQLDNTPMLELFSFVMGEDWDEYELFAFDSHTWVEKRLMKVTTYLIANDKSQKKGIFWGYPGNMYTIDLKKENGKILLPVSMDLQELKDRKLHTCYYPVFFFKGVPSDWEKEGNYTFLETKVRYMSLNQLLGMIDAKFQSYLDKCHNAG